MKLFLYDGKHEQVIGEMNLPNDNNVQEIIEFLDKQHITSRYKQLIVAESYTQSTDEDGFNRIEFQYEF